MLLFTMLTCSFVSSAVFAAAIETVIANNPKACLV